MINNCVAVILFALLLAVSEVLTISTFLNNDDQQRLQEMFKGVYPLPDIQSAHFSIFGLKLLGVPQLPSKVTFLHYNLALLI